MIIFLYLNMKTNQIMNSSDRELFGVQIKQETKTGFLNLSDLQDAYAFGKNQNGWAEKRIDHILNYSDNIERVYYILKEAKIFDVRKDTFIENVAKNGIIKALKEYNVYKTTGARHTKTTWCNPYIWVLLALELHPELYGKTVVWLTDKLIINRIEAGNFYKELTKAIGRFSNIDYVKLATALNYVVFGRHETGIRNTANQTQLKEMETLENQLSFAINMGYIKSFPSLIDELRKMYDIKLAKQKAYLS